MKKKILLIVSIFCLFLVSGCSQEEELEMPKENPIVTMSIENYGDITIELYPEIAPNTVANFVNLVESGFYTENDITRVQKGFVIQGGGSKTINYAIKGEFEKNGFKNDLTHTEGVISMARTSDMNSAGGQFFIVLDDNAKYSLDGMYAGFGKVTEGMDILHEMEESDNLEFEDTSFYFLKNPIKITKCTVDTKGYKYKVKKI